jgi:hypothetical protein
MAYRHVIEQEARIVRQKILIERLIASHLPIEAATRLLETMEEMLSLFVDDYVRLSRRPHGPA